MIDALLPVPWDLVVFTGLGVLAGVCIVYAVHYAVVGRKINKQLRKEKK